MTREKKYPDTETFTFYNPNPHGRFGGDCVIRAICTVLGESWEETLKGLCEVSLKTGYVPSDPHAYAKYLDMHGWRKCRQPRKPDGTKYTAEEFCREHGHGKYVAHVGSGHVAAIIDGKVLDTWDSTDYCVGNYWTREKR